MKHLLILFMVCPLAVFGQITELNNGPRSGDELVKQQVDFKDPGRRGDNVIWDFGKLQSINDEYTLAYSTPYLINGEYYIMGADTVYPKQSTDKYLIGTEHSTMYYLKNSGYELEVLGHQNATTSLRYLPRLFSLNYPLNYKDSVQSSYESEGLYSCRIPFITKGDVKQEADAYGVMILPSGDTLKHVMRVKTLQTIEETIYDVNKNINGVLKMNVENYKWFSKGYRYPIFETIKTYDVSSDSTDSKNFSTAFFFPPQEHLYLDTDSDNLAVLDSLWNIDHKLPDVPDPGKEEPTVNLSYNFYPNPIDTYLTVEYYLERPSSVTISLYSLEGRLVKTEVKAHVSSGVYSDVIDCSNLVKGTYILSIGTGYKVYSDKVIKK